ncbi:hypothetical protein [Clostridium estertheticum]|uniref:Uncharacterized protein n=1 Tax=Clostridium estertheticum subsp. estertheticum TaxID=1552 RepID=A0A1J0GIB3_9CLOT|nr:hypothetical protein [Clostridium estertheticum]APC41051.1 hypothetical protein A7L45_13690 [Clostridium estertheticum subsp. estertheticum]
MGLPSYVVNFDELVDAIKGYLENGIKVDVGDITFSTADMEKLLAEIRDKIQGIDYGNLIKALNDLGVKLTGLLTGDDSGAQHMYGEMIEIPATIGDYVIEFKPRKNGRITGITYSQSTWNFKDNWDLFYGNSVLFDKVRTKEYGEHKYFNVFLAIRAGESLKFIHHNDSGTSKVIWVDFEMLEGYTETPQPKPETGPVQIVTEKFVNSNGDISLEILYDVVWTFAKPINFNPSNFSIQLVDYVPAKFVEGDLWVDATSKIVMFRSKMFKYSTKYIASAGATNPDGEWIGLESTFVTADFIPL